MKLLDVRYQICFLLFLKSFGVTDNGSEERPVYVQKGDNAIFMFDVSTSILYARFGGNGHDFDAEPRYMRVPDNSNASDEPKSDRVEFCGDLKTGKLCFIWKNVDADVDNKIFRIYCKTNDTDAPKTIDFIIRIQEAPPSTSESSSTHSTSTQAPSSTNSTDVNRTTEFPTTQPPSNSTVDPPEATGSEILWIVGGSIIAVVVVVVVVKRNSIRRKIKGIQEKRKRKSMENEPVSGEHLDDDTANVTLNLDGSVSKKHLKEVTNSKDLLGKQRAETSSLSVCGESQISIIPNDVDLGESNGEVKTENKGCQPTSWVETLKMVQTPQEGSKDLVLDSCKKKEPDEKEQKFDHKTNTRVFHRCNSVPQSLDY